MTDRGLYAGLCRLPALDPVQPQGLAEITDERAPLFLGAPSESPPAATPIQPCGPGAAPAGSGWVDRVFIDPAVDDCWRDFEAAVFGGEVRAADRQPGLSVRSERRGSTDLRLSWFTRLLRHLTGSAATGAGLRLRSAPDHSRPRSIRLDGD